MTNSGILLATVVLCPFVNPAAFHIRIKLMYLMMDRIILQHNTYKTKLSTYDTEARHEP